MGLHLFTQRRATAGGLSVEESAPAAVTRGREALALVLVAAAIYLVLALAGVRVDPGDPSVAGPAWVGPVGDALGTALARGFGVVAWLAPVELGLVAWPLFRGRPVAATSLRLAGDLVSFVIAAALVHVAFPGALVFGGLPSGGNVGLFFGELMQALFSAVGSFLVGVTVIGLVWIGRSEFSFIEWVGRAGRAFMVLRARALEAWRKVAAAVREARAVSRERDAALRAASVPKIDEAARDATIFARLEEEDDEDFARRSSAAPPLSLTEELMNGQMRHEVALGADALPAIVSIPRPAAFRKSSPEDLPAAVSGEPADADLEEEEGEEPSAEPRAAASAGAPPASPDASEPTIVDTRKEREVKRAARTSIKRRAGFQLPSTELLYGAPPQVSEVDKRRVFELSEKLERTLLDYGVTGKVVEIHPGPTVTTYEVAPEAGTKVSKIAGLSDDLALGLSRKVRIVAPIPGKSRIGFELPNDERQPVNLRELVEDKRFDELAEKVPLPVVLGRDIVGAPFYADLASMPHVIVAGATGAGKSVGLNVMLSSLLFRRTPDELRLLMIDPKVVELAPFDGIPHMLLPVVTDMKQAAKALKWAVDEMERRYQLFANAGTKNITTYNRWVHRIESGELPAPKVSEVEAIGEGGVVVSVPSSKEGTDGQILPGRLPYIVIVVDEFADLMMQQGKDVEAAIARLAQKARAAGMHVVLATQRPSVDVITGMIKANFPTRIAFRVAQKVDSRTILDEQGSELLLGKGDMLVKMNGQNDMRRVQCPFVSEEEVDQLTSYLRTQGAPVYHDVILQGGDDEEEDGGPDEPADPRFDEAVRIVAETRRCSTSWLQRKMTIGYNRAAKIVETMEKMGMVGPPNGAKDREVLIQPH